MNDRAASVFLFGLVIVIGMCAAAFIVWLLSSLVGDICDHFTGHWKRISNARIDANYRKGQFYVPPSMRDFK